MNRAAGIAAAVSWQELSNAIEANPTRGQRPLSVTSASGTLAVLTSERETSFLPGWNEDTTQTLADVVSLVLWVHEPMYRGAASGVRRAMEAEEAGTLLELIDASWRKYNGRRRGWVRKHLEEDLRGRSAGAEVAPAFWENARTKKRTALLVDYVCLLRGIRVALWSPSHGYVTVIPMMSEGHCNKTFVQFALDSERVLVCSESGRYGFPMDGAASAWPALVKGTSCSWSPPISAPSGSAQTVAQIQEALVALGIGKDAETKRGALWSRLQWETFLRDLAVLA